MDYIFDNERPIYLQLVEKIRLEIISGKLKSGERLPSVRELALTARVNPNAMQKALVELENLKLIFTEWTNGKYVTTDNKLINKYKLEYAEELTREYFSKMDSIGLTKKEVKKYIEKIGGENEWIS